MNIEFKVKSMRSGNRYKLRILKEKERDEWRICNITKGHICPCIFSTSEEAINDVYKFEKEGKIKILLRHDSYVALH